MHHSKKLSRCDGRVIAVIDDHSDTLELIAEVLERAGGEARSFASAREALESIEASPPDVVITDLWMPSMSGSELAARLRESPRTSEIPLVALSGAVQPSVHVVRLFDAFLFKPVDPHVLPGLVDALAQRGQRMRKVVGHDVAGRAARRAT